MRTFRYKTSFSSYVKGFNLTSGKKLSLAALDNLKSIIPADVMDNEALLPICFNACVINRANKNGDIMGTETGLSIFKKFNHSQVNAEHNRDIIIGHVVGTALSSFDENYAIGAGSEIITDPMTLAGSTEPFNISLSAVLYKVLGSNLEDMIVNATDPSSPNYLGVSASWEVGFDDYVIAVGSQNLADCQIITDPTAITGYSKYLTCMGGTGKTPDGKFVFRMITGDVLPLGIGLTYSPAAPVAGIVIPTSQKIDEPVGDDKASNPGDPGDELAEDPVVPDTTILPLSPEPDELEEIMKDLPASTNVSKNNKTDVTQIETPILNQDMKFKSFEEALASLTTDESTATFTREELKSLLADEILKANDAYKGELNQAQTDKATLLESKTAVELEKTTLAEKVSDLTTKLAELTEAQRETEAVAKFDERMASMDNQYNLTDKQREIIAKSIRGLSDEDFGSYLENQAAFLVVKAEIAPVVEPVETPATTEAIASVVAAIVPKPEPIANGLSTESSFLQKLKDSFSQTEIVSVNRRK